MRFYSEQHMNLVHVFNSNLENLLFFVATRLRSQMDQPSHTQVFNGTSVSAGLHPATINALALSPSYQPSPSGSHTERTSPVARPKKERMHHNIPHRFLTGLNSRPTTCAVCLGSVHFVKQAAKCQGL